MNNDPLNVIAQLTHQAVPIGEWHDLARCAETDPELFFPEKGDRPDQLSGSAAAARSAPNASKRPWAAGSGSECGVACPNANAASWPSS